MERVRGIIRNTFIGGGPVQLPNEPPPKRPFITVYCYHMMYDRFRRGAPEIDCQQCCQFKFPDSEPFITHFREHILSFMRENCPHKDKIKVKFVKLDQEKPS